MMDKDFLAMIESALPKFGMSDRSSFIRQAVKLELARMGIVVPDEITTAPSRSGKGGRPKKVIKIESYMAAEEPPAEVKKSQPKPKKKP